MATGTRQIDGREFLLNGRYSDQEAARKAAEEFKRDGYLVRVIKLWQYDYMIYVHGPVGN